MKITLNIRAVTLRKICFNNWSEEVKNFVKVIPNDYKKVITVLDEELEKGTDRDEAMLIAFENVTGKKVEIA